MSNYVPSCSLSREELDRVAQRYARAAETYSALVTYVDDVAKIRLTGEKQAIARLLDEMVERESGCCSHLNFDLAETANGFIVSLTAQSDDASPESLRPTVAVLFPAAAEQIASK